MGSVVLGDVVPARTGLPYTMLAGSSHHDQHRSSEAIYRSSRLSQRASPSSDGAAAAAAAAARPSPRHAKSSRSSNASAVPSQQQHPPTTDPISVPRARANSQPVSLNPSSELNASAQPAVPNPSAARDPYTQATPPYESASAYLPSHRTSAAVSAAAPSSSHAPAPRARAGGQPMLNPPNCVKVRDLAHIQQLAREELLRSSSGSRVGSSTSLDDVGTKYDISAMSVTDIIEMVAGLLTKITTTNDRQHEHLHQHIPPADGAAGLSPQTSSVLSFHGKNVPTITISSYLTRIHRYCPTTYEVFLGLLVYFDRMTERVNFGPPPPPPQQHHRQSSRPGSSRAAHERRGSGPGGSAGGAAVMTPLSSTSAEAADRSGMPLSPSMSPETYSATPKHVPPTQFFVVDSYNIHRLIIAGVTCASKFFSDVFYTNSRYAKVGGLPLVELNHLEIQFLILNDFRLMVPVEELEAYGTMLVEFYIREVTARERAHLLEGSDVTMGGIQTPTPP